MADPKQDGQTATSGSAGVWPDGEPQTVRDAYDRLRDREGK